MMHDSSPLAHLAQLARSDDLLLAGLLFRYQEMEGLSDEALARYLQCDPAALPRLALCRRPRAAPLFRTDVEQIARFTGANPFQLVRLIRAGESRQALRPHATAILLAARDHTDPDIPGRPKPENDNHGA